MKRSLLSTFLLSAIFIFLAGILPHTTFAKVSIKINSIIVQAGSRLTVSYSGAEDGQCYAWRLGYNGSGGGIVPDDPWVHSGNIGCDKSEKNYDSAIVNSSGTFTLQIPSDPGNFTIYFFKKGGDDCIRTLQNETCSSSSISTSTTPITPVKPLPTYDCDNRPPGCSKDNFPGCQANGSYQKSGNCANSASSVFSCAFDTKGTPGSGSFCAFAAGVSLPPSGANFNCTIDSNLKTPAETCPVGWSQGYKSDIYSNACQCWPDNIQLPAVDTSGGNGCPVCDSDHPYYFADDASCHKDDGTSSEKAQPLKLEDCGKDACDPGNGCTLNKLKIPPSPVCADYDETAGSNTLGSCQTINTAIGPLNIQLSEFTKTIFSLLLSVSGLIILYIVIRSGYILLFSQGNAEKVKEAQDRLTSAVVGLLFLIFSLIVLQTIGVDILHIPGFS